MNKQQLFAYVAHQYGITPDYPWTGAGSANAVLRHPSNGKWFALAMPVMASKLGLSVQESVEIVLLKNEPLVVAHLREQVGIFSAYHMNKEHWISVLLESESFDTQAIRNLKTVSDEQLAVLIDTSFSLTAPAKVSRKTKGKRQN
ncbi:MmcQ/YjbR family DNA-binding protein [Atopobium fossor]|uniref:MmcQ/YjbR family DNA-binding protein n=1 Tax=Atopobium fossor TaxID=39487 RepID=UPI0003F80A20|nr:MmcQ/YjbR family DNA-binding protein [Atopobium fossor]